MIVLTVQANNIVQSIMNMMVSIGGGNVGIFILKLILG